MAERKVKRDRTVMGRHTVPISEELWRPVWSFWELRPYLPGLVTCLHFVTALLEYCSLE